MKGIAMKSLVKPKKMSALKLRGFAHIQFFFLYLNTLIVSVLVVIPAIIQLDLFEKM